MEEPSEYHFRQDSFLPMHVSMVDPWKHAVQDVVSDVTAQVLHCLPEERTYSRLIEWFKATWFSRIPLEYFEYETSYYLWLIHISGHLLPKLERESGTLSGWMQHRLSRRPEEKMTVPVVKQTDRLKLYLFETDPEALSRTAETLAFHVSCSSTSSPDLLEINSAGDGRSSIHTLSYPSKRKQDG
ncbi:hypothetical protein [Salibacterium sp. K-3]